MKTVVNLVDDYRPGGIRSLLDDLTKAMATRHIDWRTQVVDSARPFRVRGAADAILVHYSTAWRKLPWLASLRLSRPRTRLILVEHHYTRSFAAQHVSNPRRFRRLLRTAYGLADAVVAVSAAQADWLLEEGVAGAEKIGVIDACRDYSEFLAIPPKEAIPKRVVIGAMGRLVRLKGFDVLIAAMRRLPADRFLLRIAGAGEEDAALRAMAAGMPNVEFVGHVDAPADFLSACDMFAMPSRSEAFGLVCAEAKAAGLPVVVSDVDALPAQARGCGAVVAVDDVDGFASAIEQVARPDALRRLRKRARQGMAEAWPRYLADWTQLLA